MDCLDVLAGFFGSIADWAMVVLTLSAVVVAGLALRYSKQAWKSQIREEAKTRKQLGIAQVQHQAFLESLNRDRRRESPCFSLAAYHDNFDLYASGRRIPLETIWKNEKHTNSSGLRDWRELGKPLRLLLKDINPTKLLLESLLVVIEDAPHARVTLEQPKLVLSGSDLSNKFEAIASEYWLLEIYDPYPGSSLNLAIGFDTQAGVSDIHRYGLVILEKPAWGGGALIVFHRIDPPDVSSMWASYYNELTGY